MERRLEYLVDLQDFIEDHCPHGSLAAHATGACMEWFLLTVACPCGVVFERWVTPLDAELDLLRAAGLN